MCSDPGQSQLVDSQNVDSALVKMANMDNSIDTASDTTNRLSVSYYALIAWVVVVTACLAAVVVVTYRHWILRRRQSLGGETFPPDKSEADGVSVGRGSVNGGFDDAPEIVAESTSSSPADGITLEMRQ